MTYPQVINPNDKPTIGIIGYGRFGKLMLDLLDQDYQVLFFDNNSDYKDHPKFRPLEEITSLAVVILAVPIGKIEPLLKKIAPFITAKLVIDVCSVKVYPTQWMLQYLPKDIAIIASHPLFGPDSYRLATSNSMVMFPVRIEEAVFQNWCDYFRQKKIHIDIITPEEHDKTSALSQQLTHFLGRILSQMNLKENQVATQGYKSLLKIIEQTCHDSWELFFDMIKYNPYSQQMIKEFDQAKDNILIALRDEASS